MRPIRICLARRHVIKHDEAMIADQKNEISAPGQEEIPSSGAHKQAVDASLSMLIAVSGVKPLPGKY